MLNDQRMIPPVLTISSSTEQDTCVYSAYRVYHTEMTFTYGRLLRLSVHQKFLILFVVLLYMYTFSNSRRLSCPPSQMRFMYSEHDRSLFNHFERLPGRQNSSMFDHAVHFGQVGDAFVSSSQSCPSRGTPCYAIIMLK